MNTVNTIEINSKAIQGQTYKYQKYNKNLVTIEFSYNFRIGKTRNLQKQINNKILMRGLLDEYEHKTRQATVPSLYPGAKHLDKTQQTQDGGRE